MIATHLAGTLAFSAALLLAAGSSAQITTTVTGQDQLPVGTRGNPAEPLVIAVIDSGVDYSHPDLAGKFVGGFDFVDDDSFPEDELGHGTQMSGIMVASGAFQGLCPNCQVMPFKVVDPTGAADQLDVAAAINDAVANDVDLIFVGVGSTGAIPELIGAVANAENAGIPIIAPAGSEGLSTTLYPAKLPSVISVVAAAADETGLTIAHIANTSGREDVAARGDTVETVSIEGDGGIGGETAGSSAAAAYVTGVAARALQANPNLTTEQIRQVLRNGVDPIAVPGWYDYFSYGVSNLTKTLNRTGAGFKDVAVTRILAFPDEPLTGQANFVRVTVQNQGNAATGLLALTVTWSGAPPTTIPATVGPLGIGEEEVIEVNLPLSALAGPVQVDATVTPVLGETELSNNTLGRTVNYVNSARHDVDLDVAEIGDTTIQTTFLDVPFTLRNRGNQDENSVTVELLFDGVVFGTKSYSLAVAEEKSDSFHLFMTLFYILGDYWGDHKLRVRATLATSDETPENNDWHYGFTIVEEATPATLQYSDVTWGLVMDAPWKTIRDYVPFLYFFPHRRGLPLWSLDLDIPLILSMELYNYDVSSGSTGSLIFRDKVIGSDTYPSGHQILDPQGNNYGGLSLGTLSDFKPFWHVIYRIPTSAIGSGSGPQHVQARINGIRFLLWFTLPIVNRKVLKVQIDAPEDAFPVFDGADRHLDAHVHTIAEQSKAWDILAPRKNYGGPLAMLMESTHCLGMTDKKLTGGNWTAFKNELVVTDHNVFYSSSLPYELPASVPGAGPTSTVSPSGEADWYRDNLGRLAGEEVALKSGTNQTSKWKKVGHHFLSYDAAHFEGPWHGGDYAYIGQPNTNTLQSVLGGLKSDSDNDSFGYAAHPLFESHAWPDEYFNEGIFGDPDDGDTGSDTDFHVEGDRFLLAGLQVWNTRRREKSAKSSAFPLYLHINPFEGGPGRQRFTDQTDWYSELDDSLDKYLELIGGTFFYSFSNHAHERFIRKLYMAAGTDAHGDFNYTDDVLFRNANFNLDTNAYGVVRTNVLTHEYKAGGSALDATHAYQRGISVLTDGPIAKFNLDGNGRHDSAPGADPVWHDAFSSWENAEGRIGGNGYLDGERTVLVPLVGGETNVHMQSLWKMSTSPDASNVDEFSMFHVTPDGTETFTQDAGSPDLLRKQQLATTGAVDRPSAFVLKALDNNSDEHRKERCITNPVWAMPVKVTLDDSPPYILPGDLRIELDFPLSMSGQDVDVWVDYLDDEGNSLGSTVLGNPFLMKSVGWQESTAWDPSSIANGRYVVENDQPIPPLPGWDAEEHTATFFKYSFVVYTDALTDAHGNTLNPIAATWTRCVFPEPLCGCIEKLGSGCSQFGPDEPILTGNPPEFGTTQTYEMVCNFTPAGLGTFLFDTPIIPPISFGPGLCESYVFPSGAPLFGTPVGPGVWTIDIPFDVAFALGEVFALQGFQLDPTTQEHESTNALLLTYGCP